MELEELKSTWQSVKPEIGGIGGCLKDAKTLRRQLDIKSRLLRKVFLGELFSSVCVVLLSTSHLWSPTKLPVSWLVSFCAVIVVGIICGAGLYLEVRRVDLWEDSNAAIFSAIVRVKRIYRRTELAICILIMPLLIWLSLIPPFFNTPDMYIVWGLTVVCFGLEYLWYRSNVRQLNNLVNWEDN